MPQNATQSQPQDCFGLMFSTSPDGGLAAHPHDAAVLSFEYNGMAITNPCLDESTVASADPRGYGFVEAKIGAVTALRLDLPDGDFLMLSDELGLQLPDAASILTTRFSRHTSDGLLQAYCFIGDIP
ncbi:hypothetical protein D3C77_439330 [compost metagenome]